MVTASISENADTGCAELATAIERAAHLLPAQGPIDVFVHHNTLHAFEDQNFDDAVADGLKTFDASPYWPEDRYRECLLQGRIRVADLEEVLQKTLGDTAELLVANLGTRYALRLAMLQFPLRNGNAAELNWLLNETSALKKFRAEVPSDVRWRMMDEVDSVAHDPASWVHHARAPGGSDIGDKMKPGAKAR